MTLDEKRSLTRFLLRLKDFGKISEADFDLTCGKLWGYPQCCINYYMRISAVGYPPGFITDLVLGNDDLTIDYVRCPKCRKITGEFDFSRFHPKFKKKKIEEIEEYFS